MDGALPKEMLSFEFRSSFRIITSSVVCLFLNSLIAFVNLGPDLVNPVQLASCTWIKGEVWESEKKRKKERKECSVAFLLSFFT